MQNAKCKIMVEKPLGRAVFLCISDGERRVTRGHPYQIKREIVCIGKLFLLFLQFPLP